MNGIELIIVERLSQELKHNKTTADDVRNKNHRELTEAAVYLLSYFVRPKDIDIYLKANELGFDKEVFKHMVYKNYKERLVIAGALIAAELDRLEYITLTNLLEKNKRLRNDKKGGRG